MFKVLLASIIITSTAITDNVLAQSSDPLAIGGKDTAWFMSRVGRSDLDSEPQEPFKIAVDKMKPKGDCIWMIGDNPINDIKGSKDSINAVTFQKIHKGIVLGEDLSKPDASFQDFYDLRELLKKLSKTR